MLQLVPSQVAVPGPSEATGQDVQLVPQLAVDVLLTQLELHRWEPLVQVKVQEPPLEQPGVEFGGFERGKSVQLDPPELTPGDWQGPAGRRRGAPRAGRPPAGG